MMLLSAGLSMWVLIAGAYAFGEGDLETSNWGTVPIELQKAQLDTTYVVLTNDTWSPFFFDNVGSWAFPQFQVTVTNNTASTTVQWVDTFCAGDAFSVYFLSSQAFNGSFNGRNPVGVASCANYTLDPTVATSRGAFSWGALINSEKGVYNITVIPRISPFSAGKGYIKVTYPT